MTGPALLDRPPALRRLVTLPAHVRHVDLLVFLQCERARPTPWVVLAAYAATLARALVELRPSAPPRGDAPDRSDRAEDAPLPLVLADARIGEPPPEGLRPAASADRVAEAPPGRPEAHDAERLEERLVDLLAEIELRLVRLRRLGRLPERDNPLGGLAIEALPVRSSTRAHLDHVRRLMSAGAEES